MNTPEVIGCSWLSEREFMGRGRSAVVLDGGMLDLGIIRDSTLNSTNDFQVFGETFEQAAQAARAYSKTVWAIAKACDVPPEILGIDPGE